MGKLDRRNKGKCFEVFFGNESISRKMVFNGEYSFYQQAMTGRNDEIISWNCGMKNANIDGGVVRIPPKSYFFSRIFEDLKRYYEAKEMLIKGGLWKD